MQTFTITLGISTLILAFLSLNSCSQGADPRGKGKKEAASDDEGDAVEGNPDGLSPPDGKGEADEGDRTDGGPSLEQVLKDCGGGDAAQAGPDDIIYEKSLKSLPIVKTVLIIKVTVESQLDIKVTGAKTVQDSKVKVASIEGLLSGLAKGEADRQAAANSGASTLTNVPISEYGGLSDHKAYDGIVCTVVPATKIDNRRGGKKTVAEFDPPIPASISPRAIGARYEAELGKKKVFQGIKVKILESDNPDLEGQKTLTGTVTIEKVAKEIQVDDGAGGKKTVKGDVAYRMTYNFKNPKATFALGFAPSVTYYIDHEKHDLRANIVDTTSVEGGVAVFLHP